MLCVIPQVPIMLNQAEKMFPHEKGKASDLCSSIKLFNNRIGVLSGPIYGGYMNYLLGFRTTCDITSIILILYSIIFFLFTREYVEIRQEPELTLEDSKPTHNSIIRLNLEDAK